jgi:outer membrane receptor protein involved in Fe transport
MNYPPRSVPSSVTCPWRHRFIDRGLLAALVSISLASFAAAQVAPATTTTTTTTTAPVPNETQVTNPGEEPVVLSPFNVYESTNVGYGASTTSSTARYQQDYISLPQTVNVVTSEFLTDFNVQDVREAYESIPNIEFGLQNNPYADRIRGAIVDITYSDGVALPAQYSAMPMDFYDRIEIVKGPSSIAFGLGDPGGLINYVSKMPQGIESTSIDYGMGTNSNYLFRFDRQGIDRKNGKLSYRLVGFWENGGYAQPNEFHSGMGAQLSLKYDIDKTSNLALIVGYSSTDYPSEGIVQSIWQNYTIYRAWLTADLGAGVFYALPGTKYPNGSVFGVSGQLPVPNTLATLGILGTGQLAGPDTNANPPGWAGDTERTFRSTLIYSKDFGDHWHFRNALVLDFNNSDNWDETPDNVLSIPGTANTLPAAAAGNPYYGEPNGIYATMPNALYNPTGAPYTAIQYQRSHNYGSSSARDDEIDFVGEYDLPFIDAHSTTLAGADFYDNENYGYGYQVPDQGADGNAQWANLYSNSNPREYVANLPVFVSNDSGGHTWGDGFYAQEQVNFWNDHIEALAGWRIDYFDTEIRNNLGGNSFPGWVNTKGAPRFALTIKPLKWLSFYCLDTQHHDPSATTNKYFLSYGEYTPALQAEYPIGTLESFSPGGITIEGGAKATFLGGKLYASVAVFHEITSGQLNTVPAITTLNPDGTTSQIGENLVQGVNAHGIEAELFGQVTDRLSFKADYGNLHGNFPPFIVSQAGSGAQGSIPLSVAVPNWVDPSATLSVHGKLDFGGLGDIPFLGDLRHATGFYVTFGGTWLSPYWIYQQGNASQYYGASQYIWDGGVGYRWRNGRFHESLYLNCDNISDSVVSIGTVTPWTVEPMRATTLTYRISF